MLEGEHLISQYLAHAPSVETLICAEGTDHAFAAKETIIVAPGLMAHLSDLASPPRMIAFATIPKNAQKIPSAQMRAVLALDDVQDPGNMGAILRTAVAVGIDEVWTSGGCAFPWSQKVLRASQGVHCGLAIRDAVGLADAVAEFKGNVVVTTLASARSLHEITFTANVPTLFIVGNEGAGVSAPLLHLASTRVRIPMCAPVESLNVGVATAVLLYEWARQCRTN